MFPGGYDGQNFLSIMEVYDPATDVWTVGQPLTSGRSGHASAVSYHVPNLMQSDNCCALSSRTEVSSVLDKTRTSNSSGS